MRRDEGLVALAALALGACVAAMPFPPATDWPQHLALAALLRRLWDGDPVATALFAPNPATHNAGVHLLLAAAARWVPVTTAGRLLLGCYPPLLLLAVARLLRRLDLPAWRALLLVPAVLGFSFGWGLINFCLGSALAWLLVEGVLAQIERPSPGRALAIAAGSLALGVTHVMAMLLACLVAAVAGVERALRAPRRAAALARAALAGLLLLPGCIYDLHIYFLHTSKDPGAYTSPAGWAGEPGVLSKLGIFGALLSGLFTGNGDTVIAWLVVALLAGLAWAARGAGRSPLLGPLPLLLALYLATPSVFFNTHLVFQRLPQWALVAAVAALPALRGRAEGLGRRGALGLAGVYLAALPVQLGLHAREAGGALEVLASTPVGVCVTGVIEEPRTAGARVHALVHAAALAVPAGASEDAFSFARWMGLPVVYRPGLGPPYPERSWEHDGRRYSALDPLARRCPVALVRSAWPEEPEGVLRARLFSGVPARVLARSGAWWLVDTRP
ncbi:MAG: hypothetical protein MUF64_17450 [Polyangiaceae bacterium]|nr:hypothetical protein [Polyangiaceae bacterium]